MEGRSLLAGHFTPFIRTKNWREKGTRANCTLSVLLQAKSFTEMRKSAFMEPLRKRLQRNQPCTMPCTHCGLIPVRPFMRTSVFIFPLLILLLVSGCADRFSGTFVFKNNSSKRIWVDASGFEHTPPVGVLSPGIFKGASMNPQRLPDVVTISWYEMDVLGTSRTNISLAELPTFPGSGRITFEFMPAERWVLKYDRRN